MRVLSVARHVRRMQRRARHGSQGPASSVEVARRVWDSAMEEDGGEEEHGAGTPQRARADANATKLSSATSASKPAGRSPVGAGGRAEQAGGAGKRAWR